MPNPFRTEAALSRFIFTPLSSLRFSEKLEDRNETLSILNELRVVLNSNSDKYELYKNPKITIQFPEQFEDIEVMSISSLYAEDFKIKKTYKQGNNIVLELEGEQLEYLSEAIDGPTFIIKANLTVNKMLADSNQEIKLVYINEKAINYKEKQTQGEEFLPINIVAKEQKAQEIYK